MLCKLLINQVLISTNQVVPPVLQVEGRNLLFAAVPPLVHAHVTDPLLWAVGVSLAITPAFVALVTVMAPAE